MILLRLITTVAVLAATATAGVVRRDNETAMDVDTTTLGNLDLYEQYSAAAYCFANDIATPGTPIRCAAGNCPLVETNLATVFFSFLDVGKGGVSGFVAADNINRILVLVFRGIRSVETGITTLDTRLVDTSLCGATVGCQVNEGFQDSWDSVSARITREIANAQAATTFTTLVVTGHGVGGALATLAATLYRTTPPVAAITTIDLYTYGSPRVGNGIFATFVTTGNDAINFRATHTDDPIPKFPSRALGYLQWGPEYWIRAPTGQAVHTTDITKLSGTETPFGNGGTPPIFDIPAHLWYFNGVAKCI